MRKRIAVSRSRSKDLGGECDMKHVNHRRRVRASMKRTEPPTALVAKIRKLHLRAHSTSDNFELSDAYRKLLRSYRALISTRVEPGGSWRRSIRDALGFLGGQAD